MDGMHSLLSRVTAAALRSIRGLCSSLVVPLHLQSLLATATAMLAMAHGGAVEPGKTRLFIFSGQSNMANLLPEESFLPAVQKALPGDELIVVHVAINGQQIRMWLKDWKPPEGMAAANGKEVRLDGNGRLYASLMQQVNEALTGKPKPDSVTFMWLQGEADARAGYGAVYEASLRTVHANLVKDLGRSDVDWVIARISDYGNDLKDELPDWNLIREIQVRIAESTPRSSWIDNDDLNGKRNGLHYPPDGYKQLGLRFADAAIALIKAGGQ